MTSSTRWAKQRFDPDRRFGLRLTLVALALLVGAIPFTLLALLVQTKWSPLLDMDGDVANGLNDWVVAHPGWEHVLLFLTDWVWDPNTYRLLVVLLCVWLWRRGARRLVAWAAVAMVVSGLLGALLKLVFTRARPTLPHPVHHSDGWSFPSGHALAGTVGPGVLLLALLPLIPRAWRPVAWAVAIVSALGVGFTRVALGVHFVTDVIGGYVLGIAVLAATAAVFEWWRRDAGLRDVDATSEGLEPEIDGDDKDPEISHNRPAIDGPSSDRRN
ncbi:phosphatase PAP2 family protein [Streptomyces sp. SID3343]|uniref:phosphatase PAP2 family protein n=1 Tax=Streptomyces sp. SID3343 TaxID=2690260 RepID=UPI001371BF06|nr:phosphatase PAP2 family protein [Streptomyces sp. SID3343]MYV96857.1 phosphatase PAP2 family protein [Streptomyces sp. SID3343]